MVLATSCTGDEPNARTGELNARTGELNARVMN